MNQFTNCKLDNYPNILAYCQELKSLSDQLADVGTTIEPHNLVLQLVAGLNENYSTIATHINQMDKLPSFYDARSKLILEESMKNRQAALTNSTNPNTAFVAASELKEPPHHTKNRDTNYSRQQPPSRGGQSNRNNNRGGRGYGRGRGRGNWNGNGYTHQPWNNLPQWNNSNWASQNQWHRPNANSNWATSYNGSFTPSANSWATSHFPCPHPSTIWARPNGNNSSGILDPRPQANFASNGSVSSYAPTDIDQAMYTMSLNPPDNDWYMDTGASSYMSGSRGSLSPYFNLSIPKHIHVGNGNTLPIRGIGDTRLNYPYPPFLLKDVLHIPNIIKNLLSVRRLTTDNNVSLTFDPYGFSVKDFKTGIHLMRCDSTGDLYPLNNSAAQQLSSPVSFIVLPQDIWDRRLGHPGANILRSLINNKSISCSNNNKQLGLCDSCVLGKHIKLPFTSSLSTTTPPFEIVHSDVWTSPIISSSGHKY
ncbi:uncharacterized protein [Rutidosis leptorrhynchoides]|uniref:uncharacterized protein n=1 Tax=Rutidosis leptorrhynchoides TaxID=125765 RepID=UPI003A99731A